MRRLDYFTSTGIVSEAELPYTAQDTSSHLAAASGLAEPRLEEHLRPHHFPSACRPTPPVSRRQLKAYGPLPVSIYHGDLNTTTLGTAGIRPRGPAGGLR